MSWGNFSEERKPEYRRTDQEGLKMDFMLREFYKNNKRKVPKGYTKKIKEALKIKSKSEIDIHESKPENPKLKMFKEKIGKKGKRIRKLFKRKRAK